MSTAASQQGSDSTVSASAAPYGRFRAAFTVLRDVSMTGLALYGIWHQEHTGKVNWMLLIAYVVILGIVPATHAVALLRSAVPMLPQGPGAPGAPADPSAPNTASPPP